MFHLPFQRSVDADEGGHHQAETGNLLSILASREPCMEPWPGLTWHNEYVKYVQGCDCAPVCNVCLSVFVAFQP